MPVKVYVSREFEGKAKADIIKLPVVVISHGYTVKHTEYAFIAKMLAEHGYCVVSVQHDLKADAPLPTKGSLFERRHPIWKRGVQNIMFVLSQLKKNPTLDLNKVTLIGHSNGGDISMMFAKYYPQKVQKLISLDSLRYPFPIGNNISILSLRANDTKADEGVLPSSGAKIISLNGVKHIDMCDRGPAQAKQTIKDLIAKFMKEES